MITLLVPIDNLLKKKKGIFHSPYNYSLESSVNRSLGPNLTQNSSLHLTRKLRLLSNG